MSSKFDVYTIGHSTHSYEAFLALLIRWNVTAVGDVRSTPYSRRFPHFNGDALCSELRVDNISYVFLGKELGGRPEGKQFFCDGVADYEMMAQRPEFRRGIQRVVQGREKGYTIALMCSERNPLDCHRCLLVARSLACEELNVGHILGDGSLKTHDDIESELLDMANLPSNDILSGVENKIAIAYRERAKKVAYSESGSGRYAAAE